MSDNKRNKRYSRDKEPRRPIILTKKDEKKENDHRTIGQDKPRILLKPKEKEQLPPQAPQISIALRPTSSNHNDSNSAASDTNHRPIAIQSKHSSNTSSTAVQKDQNASATVDGTRPIESMAKPIPLISDYYHIQNNVQDALIETNADFFVIGVIGAQHTGKSFIANLLIDDMDHEKCSIWELLNGKNEMFKTGISKLDAKHQPNTEGIEVFITKHRTILLDCSPVLCNPYKKDAILSELDDLKMLIFLLSVCNQLIVVEDSSFNLNLLRLLRTADQMKLDLNADKGPPHTHFTPSILFVKNKCRKQSFRKEWQERTNQMYRMFFHESDMRIYTTPKATKTHNKLYIDDEQKRVNLFYFSFLEENLDCKFIGYPNAENQLAELIQSVYLSPRMPFTTQTQQIVFTEKNWFHLALAVWDSHKTNYFLRKYETFKEKEWALRI